MEKRTTVDRGQRTPAIDYSVDQTVQRWSQIIPEDAAPATTLAPPDIGGAAAEERLSTVVVTRSGGGGAFRLLEPIGVGGMGEVRAARQESLQRIVAIKQLRSKTVDDPEARRRFVAEALVAGELDHPNIVPLYELAKTERGEPFYAMKLIRGVAWSDVIDAKTTEENLEILARVCDAVAFAHSKGILHRDLKPQNVMLGEYGEVLLVDWGLGVCTVPGGKAPLLNFENALAGTASYMAPEMAAGDPDRIGIHSDVYLLGAILFRIVTGHAPHPGETVTECLIAALENRLCAVEKPGDLSQIAMTACACSPGDRYRDVRSFQAALRDAAANAQSRRLGVRAWELLDEAGETQCYETFQRAQFGFEEALALWAGNGDAATGLEHTRRSYAAAALDNEDLDLAASLIPAAEDGWRPFADRVRRLRRRRDTRRRRVRILSRVAAGLTAAVLLTLGTSFVLVSREKNRVVTANARASEQRNLALQALDTLVYSVNESLEGRPAMEGLRKSILDEAIVGLSAIAEAQAGDPRVDRRLGVAHQSMARIFDAARRNGEALDHQNQAVAVFESLLSDKRSDETERDLAEALQILGAIVANYRMGDLEVAKGHLERAVSLTERVMGEKSLSLEIRAIRATILRDLGDMEFDLGDLQAAERHYGDFMAEARQLAQVEAPEGRKLTSQALTRVADVHSGRGEHDLAYAAYESSLEVARDLVARNPGDDRYRRLVGLAEYNLADTARRSRDYPTSAEHHQRAREIQAQLVAADPSNGAHRRDLLVTLWGLGELALDQNRQGQALVHYEDALAVAEDLLLLNPDNLEARRDVFICCKEVGAVYQEQGFLAKARAAFERGLDLCRRTENEESESTGAKTDLVIALYFLADLESAAGRSDVARKSLAEGLAILEQLAAQGRLAEGSPHLEWIDDLRTAIEKLQ